MRNYATKPSTSAFIAVTTSARLLGYTSKGNTSENALSKDNPDHVKNSDPRVFQCYVRLGGSWNILLKTYMHNKGDIMNTCANFRT